MILDSPHFVTAVLNALKDHMGVESYSALGNALGVTSNNLHMWETRNSLNFNIVIGYCLKNGIGLDALFSEGKIEPRLTIEDIRDKLDGIFDGNKEILLAVTKISTELKLNKAKKIASKVSKKEIEG